MRLHGLVGFVGRGRAQGRNVKLHMATPRFRLAAGTTPASPAGFAGRFPTLVKREVGAHMRAV